MNLFEGKTIILGVPKLFNLDSLIEAELKAIGFKTVNISVHTNTFRYKNIFQRLKSLIAKNLLGKGHYKQILNFERSRNRIMSELQKVDKSDYILIIRPEVYPIDFLKDLKKRGGKMVGYQWNGLNRFPRTYEYIALFDRFFVFDGNDLEVPSVLPTTNFYPTTIPKENSNDTTDVFYAGSFYRGRIASLCDIISKCRELGLNVHYHLFSKKKKYFTSCNLSTTKNTLNYEQNIQYTYNTKILLDLKVAEHEGLSFRVLEAVGFEKKLITTNHRVRDYDFFHADNILIWTGQSKEELAAFVNKSYVSIPETIKQKYSFKNWIHYVLDEGNYTPIELPR
ncbi:MAG: hypothetical protein KF845_05550 [Cyclobacteriaceae bacterium]|nr:hypothetical protein [Cyclobacteriaceae bacterium]